MKPIYRITEGGRDITAAMQPFFLSLSVSDNVGIAADTLDIELSERDARNNVLNWPARGRKLGVWLGYRSNKLSYKGVFAVDELSYDVGPQILGVHAKAADMISSAKVRRSQSWSFTNLGVVLDALASRNGWRPAVSSRYRRTYVRRLYQLDESDLHFLTRLGELYGASAQIKNDHLIFVESSSLVTAAGQPMPSFTIPLSATGDGGRYQEMGRGYYTGVTARYSGDEGSGTVQAGSGSMLNRLREVFSSRTVAQDAVDAEMGRINGNNNTLSIPLDSGWPDIVAESEIKLDSAWPRVIQEQQWVAKSVVHTLGDGLATSVECVKPAALVEDTV